MSWFLKCFKQFANFRDRARRKELWYFNLFLMLIIVIGVLIVDILSLYVGDIARMIFGLLMMLLFIPGIAGAVRRLHDIGKSGLWILVAFIPIVGDIWLLIYLLTPGQPFDNQYGTDPKESIETSDYYNDMMKKRNGGSKKVQYFFYGLVVVLLMSALIFVRDSSLHKLNNTNKATYTVADQFKFSFPQDWEPNDEWHSLDLYYISAEQDLETGVIVYHKKDLSPEDSTEDILEAQIDSMKSEGTELELMETKKDVTANGRRIKTVMYSEETTSTDYLVSLVDFEEYDSYAIVIQVCSSYNFESEEALLADIVNSCQKLP